MGIPTGWPSLGSIMPRSAVITDVLAPSGSSASRRPCRPRPQRPPGSPRAAARMVSTTRPGVGTGPQFRVDPASRNPSLPEPMSIETSGTLHNRARLRARCVLADRWAARRAGSARTAAHDPAPRPGACRARCARWPAASRASLPTDRRNLVGTMLACGPPEA